MSNQAHITPASLGLMPLGWKSASRGILVVPALHNLGHTYSCLQTLSGNFGDYHSHCISYRFRVNMEAASQVWLVVARSSIKGCLIAFQNSTDS